MATLHGLSAADQPLTLLDHLRRIFNRVETDSRFVSGSLRMKMHTSVAFASSSNSIIYTCNVLHAVRMRTHFIVINQVP